MVGLRRIVWEKGRLAMKTFGDLFAQLINSRGYTQERLADSVGKTAYWANHVCTDKAFGAPELLDKAFAILKPTPSECEALAKALIHGNYSTHPFLLQWLGNVLGTSLCLKAREDFLLIDIIGEELAELEGDLRQNVFLASMANHIGQMHDGSLPTYRLWTTAQKIPRVRTACNLLIKNGLDREKLCQQVRVIAAPRELCLLGMSFYARPLPGKGSPDSCVGLIHVRTLHPETTGMQGMGKAQSADIYGNLVDIFGDLDINGQKERYRLWTVDELIARQ
jgi:transcriptional regulator with XRE-family HTH domain